MLTPALMLVLVAGDVSSSPRVVPFANGRTYVDSKGGLDHVVVQDAKGNVTSESWCESGGFSDYVGLFSKFRDAVGRRDRDATARLIHYPFSVNDTRPHVSGSRTTRMFSNASSLAKSYAKIFTAEVQEKIRKAEPAAVFCKDGMAMVGDGVIWANRTGVAILNP